MGAITAVKCLGAVEVVDSESPASEGPLGGHLLIVYRESLTARRIEFFAPQGGERTGLLIIIKKRFNVNRDVDADGSKRFQVRLFRAQRVRDVGESDDEDDSLFVPQVPRDKANKVGREVKRIKVDEDPHNIGYLSVEQMTEVRGMLPAIIETEIQKREWKTIPVR